MALTRLHGRTVGAAVVGLLLLLGATSVARAAKPTHLRFQVEPSSVDCFYVPLASGSYVESWTTVVRGEGLDIAMRINNPDNVLVYDKLIVSDTDESGNRLDTISPRTHKFETRTGGTYAFCFDNKRSSWHAKVVDVEIEVDAPGDEVPMLGAQEHGTETVTVVKRLSNVLHTVEIEQRLHDMRVKRHRETLESNNARVQWWSILETLVFLSAGAAQLFVVRKWFATPGGLLPTV